MMPHMSHLEFTNKTPTWVIFDLDGTLADIDHRLHHIKQDEDKLTNVEKEMASKFKPDWLAFNSDCGKDEPKHHIVELLYMMKHYGKNIAIFSGRDGTYEQHTRDWLYRMEIPFHILSMRKPKDYRPDAVVKKEMFEEQFKPEDIWLVIDDRDGVVRMWRDLGLTCLQCQKGDY